MLHALLRWRCYNNDFVVRFDRVLVFVFFQTQEIPAFPTAFSCKKPLVDDPEWRGVKKVNISRVPGVFQECSRSVAALDDFRRFFRLENVFGFRC